MKQNKEIRVLSLFSGCGGMDLGFEGQFICHRKSIPANSPQIEKVIDSNWVQLRKTRFTTVFANDILIDAAKAWNTYMTRFHKSNDIYRIESIVDLVKKHQQGQNVFPKDIDIVLGGFPCQDFSVAGKRNGFNSQKTHQGTYCKTDTPSEETRGKLYFWMKQVIDIVKPKMFIAENVKGLVSLGNVKQIIQQDFTSADNDGYIVLDPQILDAGNFGVPETRERIIFIGIRKSDLNPVIRDIFLSKKPIPSQYNPYPTPTHKHSSSIEGLLPIVTCRDVFVDLVEPDVSADFSQRFYSKAKYMGPHCQGQSEILLDGLGPTIRSEHHGNIEFRRLSVEHMGKYEDEIERGCQERRLTPRECALIQTFPPDYRFVIPYKNSDKFFISPSNAYRIIGNAVPPMLAFNIAVRIEKLWNSYFDYK